MDAGHKGIPDDRIRSASTKTGFASDGLTCKSGAFLF